IPTLVSVLATTAFPTPSRFDFITASRTAQTSSEHQYLQALNEYYYEHIEYVPESKVDDFLAVTKAKNEAVERAVRPLYESFHNQLLLQDRIVGLFQFSSPAIIMQRVLNDVAGTGAARHYNFVSQVQAFREKWVSYFTVRFLLKSPLSSAEFASFPRFEYADEKLSAVLRRLAPSLSGLLFVSLLTVFGGLALLHRYRVVDGR
ncbi:MAG: DUF3526 domain-containing protein, partial [Betaproteobacteria bacterium]